MANNFKNKFQANIGTSLATVYTVPAATTTTVIGLSLANVSASPITVTVTVTDTSGVVTANLVKNAPIPVGGSLVIIGGDQKLVLETTDNIKVQSSANTSVDAVISMLEVS